MKTMLLATNSVACADTARVNRLSHSGAGYEVVGRDSMMVAFRRIRPRLLMSKRLQ